MPGVHFEPMQLVAPQIPVGQAPQFIVPPQPLSSTPHCPAAHFFAMQQVDVPELCGQEKLSQSKSKMHPHSNVKGMHACPSGPVQSALVRHATQWLLDRSQRGAGELHMASDVQPATHLFVFLSQTGNDWLEQSELSTQSTQMFFAGRQAPPGQCASLEHMTHSPLLGTHTGVGAPQSASETQIGHAAGLTLCSCSSPTWHASVHVDASSAVPFQQEPSGP